MAQLLKALATVPEDPGVIPSPHMVAQQLSVTLILGESTVLFWLLCALCAHSHVYRQSTQTYTHIIW